MIWYRKGREAGSFHLIYNQKMYTHTIASALEVGEINPLEMSSFSRVNAISIIESNNICFLGLEYNNEFKEFQLTLAPRVAVETVFEGGNFIEFFSRGIAQGNIAGVQAIFVYSQSYNILPVLSKLGITNLTNM